MVDRMIKGIGVLVMAVAAAASFGLTYWLGKKMIPALHRLHFGQTIRDVGPSWHKNKQGTPTMGGLRRFSSCLFWSASCFCPSSCPIPCR